MTYTWKCLKCGHTQEVERELKDFNKPPVECKCGGSCFVKKLSPAAFVGPKNKGKW